MVECLPSKHKVQSSASGKGETLFCFVFKCMLEELVALGRSGKRGKKSLQVHIIEGFVCSSERLGFRCLQGRKDPWCRMDEEGLEREVGLESEPSEEVVPIVQNLGDDS